MSIIVETDYLECHNRQEDEYPGIDFGIVAYTKNNIRIPVVSKKFIQLLRRIYGPEFVFSVDGDTITIEFADKTTVDDRAWEHFCNLAQGIGDTSGMNILEMAAYNSMIGIV